MLWYTRQDLQCIEGPTVHTQGTREEMHYVLLKHVTQRHRRELYIHVYLSYPINKGRLVSWMVKNGF